MPVGGSCLARRDGCILRLQTADRLHCGYGEIAPLQGLHEETLQEAAGQLDTILHSGLPETPHLTMLNAGDALPGDLFPSVRTGIEMALLNLQASEKGKFTPLPWNLNPASTLPLNALLFGDKADVLQQADMYYRIGYRTFKLKIRPERAGEATELITELHRILGDAVQFRLDSNQSFTCESAARFLDALPGKQIAYIEEPLMKPEESARLYERTGIRIALDESLWQCPALRHELPASCLGAYILKPSRTGGISATMRLAIEARSRGLAAVISSAYDSGISTGFFARMASLLDAHPPACGLDTFRQFQRDILAVPLSATDGLLDVDAVWKSSTKPDLSRLNCMKEWTL